MQELDAALALFAALLEHLAPGRPLAPELSLGIRDSWRALVDLTYFQLHTRRDDLLQSLFSPKHLAPSAVHLLRVLSHADGLMLTALAELDVARMRTLFQATQVRPPPPLHLRNTDRLPDHRPTELTSCAGFLSRLHCLCKLCGVASPHFSPASPPPSFPSLHRPS